MESGIMGVENDLVTTSTASEGGNRTIRAESARRARTVHEPRRRDDGAWIAGFLLALASLVSAQPAWPPGYGERWIAQVDGWIWSPRDGPEREVLHGRGAPDGEVSLPPGAWWFVEARDFESFRVVESEGQAPGEASLEFYVVSRGSADVGPRPDHLGAPPRRTGLLAVNVPWVVRGHRELRAELPPGEAADWVALKCVVQGTQPYRFRIDAYERVRPHESWERLERMARRSAGRAWDVPSDPETLRGHDVGRFLRSHRILLPWAPAEDSEAERSLRAAAWVATDLMAREPVYEHARSDEWTDDARESYVDDLGRRWMRAMRLQRRVEGPCVMRVVGRLAWPALAGEQLRNLDVTVTVGEMRAKLSGWPSADIEETSRFWDGLDRAAGKGGPPERTLLASPREMRMLVPPGEWTVTVESAADSFLLVQEVRSIDQAEHRSPFRTMRRFQPADARTAASEAVALELVGQHRPAMDLLAAWQPDPAEHPTGTWFAWKRLALALALGDLAAADAVAPDLARVMPDLRGDLAAEVRLALLRYALATRRDGMAGTIAQWIFDDPPAEPEDFTEALAAWCTGRRPLERMRAWPLTAPPATLRRFLRDIEASAIREVFGTWADLGTVGTTAGGRRWLVPIEPQVDRRTLRGDAYSAWLNLRSLSGAGPWHVARARDLHAKAIGDGYVQVLPAADWVPPVSLDMAVADRGIGRIRFRDPHAVGLVSLRNVAAGEPLTATPAAPSERVYLWRGQNVIFGQAARDDVFFSVFKRTPRAVRHTGHTPEGWAYLTDLFPLQGQAGSPVSLDFRGEDYGRAGIARYRFAMAMTTEEGLLDHDVPFTIYAGGEPLPGRRLLWIAEEETEIRHEGAESPRVETYAGGPIVTGFILLAPGPAGIRLEAGRGVRAFGAVSELDVAATPPAVLLARGGSGARFAPPSGLWEGPTGVTGDPAESRDAAAATRAILDAAPEERAARLEERARLLLRMGRAQAMHDFEEAEALQPEGTPEGDRLRVVLAVLAFRSGDDLELRARVESLVRTGARSRELFLLAAAASLGTGDVGTARLWLDAARRQPEDGSADLERLIAAAFGEAGPEGEAADPLIAVMTDLLRLRRLDPRTEVEPALALVAERCEKEALAAARVYLHGRGARFAQWALEARLLGDYAGTSDWPPPRGVLAPFGRGVDLRSEEVVRTPPRVRLAGRFGAWQAAWMEEGAELKLELPGPELYRFEWRSAHAVVDGVPRRSAAPARLLIEGLPGPKARAIVVSEPSGLVQCERMPWAVPGNSDGWEVLAPAGKSRVVVRLQAGAGFLTVRRVIGPSWMAWDARAGARKPGEPFPPRHVEPAFLPEPRADLVADLRRRLDEARRAQGPPEALTVLADDLLFAMLARPLEASPEWVVRALDLYLKSHADGLGNDHWQVHYDLARTLTRWSTVDISEDLPEFRRVRITQDLPDDPALAVSNALFFPFPGDTTSVLFDSDDVVEWHHRSTADEKLLVEIVASQDPPSDEEMSADVQVDGASSGGGPLRRGERSEVDLGSQREALVAVRVAARNPLVRVRARVRLLRETAAGREPVRPERRALLYRAPGGPVSFSVRGPTLVRLEVWDAVDLRATEDPAEWETDPAPIPRTLLLGVPRTGAVDATFQLPRPMYVRLSVRTVDAAALARAVPPAAPKGSLASEAEAPDAPDLRPEPPPLGREETWLPEYPGMIEGFTTAWTRDPGSRPFDTEDPERDELRGGLRFHWKPFEHPIYLRGSLYETKLAGTTSLSAFEARFHHYFSERPNLSLRLVFDEFVQHLGAWEHTEILDARLRWRHALDEQWIFYFNASFNHWWSSQETEDQHFENPHPSLITDYRVNHRRWIQLEARLRAVPWQNVVVDIKAGTRSNDDLRPWEPDRWYYGVEAKAHYEPFFVEIEAARFVRVDDDHRARRGSERRLGATLAYERWLGRGTWMSAEASFNWSPDDHSREGAFALVLRYGGRSGDRLDHVDPELVRFLGYQQARYPWRP